MKLYQRDPIYRCWRVAAIYRCLLRYDLTQEWALGKVREIHPDGSHDALVKNWFIDVEDLRLAARARAIEFTEVESVMPEREDDLTQSLAA